MFLQVDGVSGGKKTRNTPNKGNSFYFANIRFEF